MKNSDLIFEKVGDISYKYSQLCVYRGSDAINAFMEIGVTDDKIIKYTIYANNNNIELSSEDWIMIKNHAEKFLPEAIADEEG